MEESNSSSSRGVFTATVHSREQIGERFYRITLEFTDEGAKVFSNCQPGQFSQLDLTSAALPIAAVIPEELVDSSGRRILLRRPFSFSSVTPKGDKTVVEILYCTAGPASLRMTTLNTGDSVSVVGPLGRGFSVPEGKKLALLVVGGMGAGPLEHMADMLTEKEPETSAIAFAGAKTADALPFERRLDEISQQVGFWLPEFARYGIESRVATDDGSAGFHGLVTDCFKQWLDENNPPSESTIIYSCGPEVMLKRVAEIAAGRNIDCQISMERLMGCGIGLCQSCAVECKGHGDTDYKLCCKDGPVFDSKEVVFG